jgi:hypothetical protein
MIQELLAAFRVIDAQAWVDVRSDEVIRVALILRGEIKMRAYSSII